MNETKPVYWLSFGAGRNSAALGIMLAEGRLPHLAPWRSVFCDPQDESDETYDWLYTAWMPWLKSRGVTQEIIRPQEGVLERWERLSVTGSRIVRSCTDEGKVKPISRYIKAMGREQDESIIGIHAGESHRMQRERDNDGRRIHRPLVDLDIDQAGCEKIIRDAGLPLPPKSGCWHCPFMRVEQILDLARSQPCRFERIVQLEAKANQEHPGPMRNQWGRETPAVVWRERAFRGEMPGDLFHGADEKPCGCVE